MTAPDPPHRVLVVEDDADIADYLAIVLERRGFEVATRHDGAAGLAAARELRPEVLVTDVEMPGMNGLDLAEAARREDPTIAVVVITAHASVDYAVRALRGRADEFLTKPITSQALLHAVAPLAARARGERARRSARTVLAIGAHPDDVEIAVGGTLAAHADAGDPVVILTLSRGARGGGTTNRQNEAMAAAERLGARLFLEDLPDTTIPPADPTVGIIERVVAEVRPAIVYTHSGRDRHQDHRAVASASLVATRRVDTVACFQTPSATVDFAPSRFVTIDRYIDAKLHLIAAFASQTAIRDYLEPDFVRATARYWSRFGTGRYAEPLEIVRDASGVGVPDGAAHLTAPVTTAELTRES
ncbi:response regulator [Serinibacter salmoneus]|uniref:DNA-binding NtrC family response regulator n=1 Tax=Serinibacter salmoneus TaxID=556530 RepID=A0A2A9D3L9_9MICO|nr:response regulator [Serinibacter salmoneus]PFG20936.1 DNA-binding NtrC family response regulator [Serinibacter salmoneus]